jgi:hypothetical protein
MKIFDYGLRYLSERRWCFRAEDGSWRKTHKWGARLYLGTEYGLSKRKSKDCSLSPIETAMSEAAENFRVDLAGDYIGTMRYRPRLIVSADTSQSIQE